MTTFTTFAAGDVPCALAGSGGAVVTGRTAGGNPCVIELGAFPLTGAVAGLATIAAGDVGGRLAGGSGAVVAGHTIADDTGVIKGDAGPTPSAVAAFTIITTGDMVRRLADSLNVVVATGAGTPHRAVIHPNQLVPRGLRVTAGAVAIGCDVLGGQRGGGYSARNVALNTFPGRTLEQALGVTTVTGSLLVSGIKGKSRHIVVE